MSPLPQDPEIQALLQRYFDGLYKADSSILRTVFHSELAYVNATTGNHEFMDLEAYMDRIDKRTSPESRGEDRVEGIDRVTLCGNQMGMVEAHMRMIGRDYQDLLTLIQTDQGWRIITKIFAYQERGTE